ncbi:hypothetical protein EV174_000680 [Coemansia sp. RSA 2320]|nr:hypothetical protein EV174_000680 [Coemansia sp. RSA 2320]
MDSHSDLVDVLLLSDCNIYERYPELVQRVDYFLYEWTEEMLTRTESLLRKKSRGLRNTSSAICKERLYTNNGEDEAFTHARSLNIAWRQWAVGRLQLPRYPPERINWNKDADPVFLYGQMPALRLEVPWSIHNTASTATLPSPQQQQQQQLKSALKRTDLQTFLTSPTLSPLSSPPHSPMYSPAISIRENMSTASFGSDSTLDIDPSATLIKPRLRFNNSVEQCMVVFNQEKEYLPTDYEEEDGYSSSDDFAYLDYGSGNKKPTSSSPSLRRSLVIKLAPAHLKGDHRKPLTAVSAPAAYREIHLYTEGDAGEEDAAAAGYFNAYGASSSSSTLRVKRKPATTIAGGVTGYVQGCVQSVAGQVRRFVNDAVSVSTFASTDCPNKSIQQLPGGDIDSTPRVGMQTSNVVRDPFSSAPPSSNPTISADHMLFDDDNGEEDEDAIIQEFEREMLKYRSTSSSYSHYQQLPSATKTAVPPAFARRYGYDNSSVASGHHHHSAWDDDDACDYDVYATEYQLCRDDFETRLATITTDSAITTDSTIAADSTMQPPPNRGRNDSIIDRAEDTIVNTVDAVKWCASFISNYTIF